MGRIERSLSIVWGRESIVCVENRNVEKVKSVKYKGWRELRRGLGLCFGKIKEKILI